MGKITLTNIAEELAEKSKLNRESANSFLHAFIETIEKGLSKDNVVKVKGLGTFKLMTLSDRGSVDVSTGERITIKGYTKVSFTPDSSMKEFVNRPFAHFEPTELNDGYPDEEMPVDTEDALEEAPLSPAAEQEETAVEEVQEVAENEVAKEEESASNTEEIVQEEDVPTEPAETSENAEVAESLEAVAASELSEIIESIESVEAIETVTIPESPETTDSNEPIEEVAEESSTEADDSDSDVTTEVEPEAEAEEQEESTPSEEPTVENPTDNTAEQVSASPKSDVADKKGKKRMGCMGIGCLVVLLLFIAAIVAYFSVDATISDLGLFEEDKFEVADQGDIKVKPNLDKELGIKQNREPATPVVAPDTISEPTIEAVSKEVSTPAKEVVSTPAEEPKPSQPAPETKPALAPVAHTFVITEALAAKNIKDITVADTTDYSIEGTQATHTLQDGETIIQLSRKYYGDKRLWPYIVKHNNIIDFNKVSVGMKINIPILEGK